MKKKFFCGFPDFMLNVWFWLAAVVLPLQFAALLYAALYFLT